MAINKDSEVDTAPASGVFLDNRDIKNPDGIKVRLFGEQFMGYSYYQLKDGGKTKNVRSSGYPEMVNPGPGLKGAMQVPAKCLYSIVWDYKTQAPAILTLDRVTPINALKEVDANADLGAFTDYDFKFSFDSSKDGSDMYGITRLDKTDLTEEQVTKLTEFAETVDLAAFSNGEDAIKKTAEEQQAAAESAKAEAEYAAAGEAPIQEGEVVAAKTAF